MNSRIFGNAGSNVTAVIALILLTLLFRELLAIDDFEPTLDWFKHNPRINLCLLGMFAWTMVLMQNAIDTFLILTKK